jgi:hypothetical protein
MWVLRAVLDRVVLLAGVLAAGCVPGFIAEYRQRLNGRFEQVLADLAPFQTIANSEHHGSLLELVQYHLQSPDPTFHQEGVAVQSMIQSAEQLRAAVQNLNTDLAHQCLYLLSHADRPLLLATWNDFHPVFALDLPGAVFALCVGIVLWACFMLLWHAVVWVLRSIGGDAMDRHESRPR